MYQRLVSELQKIEVLKSWQQCRTKIKNLTFRYRKVSEKIKVLVPDSCIGRLKVLMECPGRGGQLVHSMMKWMPFLAHGQLPVQ